MGEVLRSLDEPLITGHIPDSAVETRAFLLSRDADPEIVDRYFSPEGIFTYSDPDFNPYALSLDDLKAGFRDRLAPLYDLVQTGLLGQYENFTFHTWNEHIDMVARMAEYHYFLRKGHNVNNLNEDVRKRIMTAASLHDIGNLINRANHHKHSVQMAERMFPALLELPNFWENIKNAILQHNEPYYVEYGYEGKTFDERQKMMGGHSIESPVLLIADKSHTDPFRVPSKARNQAAMRADIHTAGGLCWRTGFPLPYKDQNTDKQILTFTFDYMNTLDRYEAPYFPELTTPGEEDGRVTVQIPDISEAIRTFWQVSGPSKVGGVSRMGLFIDALFSLYKLWGDKLEGLNEIRIFTGGEYISFTPENTDEQLAKIAEANMRFAKQR